jgi:hypothetical protein
MHKPFPKSHEDGTAATLTRYLGDRVPASDNDFPSLAEYEAILGTAGFEVRSVE